MRADSPADASAQHHHALLNRRLQGWAPQQTGTLLFVLDGAKVLLIRKLRGHGAGKINGPGGKLEPGETPLQCALRETEEETGVRARSLRLAARLRFLDLDDDDWLGFIFVARDFTGVVRASDEAIPVWCPVDALPFEQMWDDDRIWLPRVLAGERLEGDFLFQRGRLLAHQLVPASADADLARLEPAPGHSDE
ncbi:MAG: 8-oxo-dGTP diphosphatase [Pseudomonadales bacterium]